MLPPEIITPNEDRSKIHGVYGLADCLVSGTHVHFTYINSGCNLHDAVHYRYGLPFEACTHCPSCSWRDDLSSTHTYS